MVVIRKYYFQSIFPKLPIAAEKHRPLVRGALQAADLRGEAIPEPVGRNTAAAKMTASRPPAPA